jgi:hypothetical protein
MVLAKFGTGGLASILRARTGERYRPPNITENHTAQGLYDKIAEKTYFIQYRAPL